MTGERLNVEVRPATEADLATVLHLDRETPTAPHWPEKAYAAMLAPADRARDWPILGVSIVNGEITGFCAGRVIAGSEGFVESIVVAETHRRRGLGRQLSQWLLQAMSVPVVHLEVRQSNLAAQNLYLSLGFKVEGERKKYYRAPDESAIAMVWR